MANEAEWTFASQVTLQSSGASAPSTTAGYVSASVDLVASNHSNYPYADFVLGCQFAAAIAAGKAIGLYRMDIDIDSTNDAPAPDNTYPHTLVGTFPTPSGVSDAATYYLPCTDVPLVASCRFYLKNDTDQSLKAGWTLKATPKTYAPGA